MKWSWFPFFLTSITLLFFADCMLWIGANLSNTFLCLSVDWSEPIYLFFIAYTWLFRIIADLASTRDICSYLCLKSTVSVYIFVAQSFVLFTHFNNDISGLTSFEVGKCYLQYKIMLLVNLKFAITVCNKRFSKQIVVCKVHHRLIVLNIQLEICC